jgi:hypothetical protein
MRTFVRLNQNNLVVAQMQSNDLPGSTGQLPADCLEVTGRNDGPWLGKIWNPGSQTFTDPPITKEMLKGIADSKFQNWFMARETLAGATAHNEAAGVITALTNQEATSWNNYKSALQAWIQAP